MYLLCASMVFSILVHEWEMAQKLKIYTKQAVDKC